MSIHPSLRTAAKGQQQRTVLKRSERIKHLMKKGGWTEASSVYGLPKMKITRIKVKKEKVEKPEAEAAAVATTEAKATTAKTATTKATTAKAAAAPAAEEKTKSKEKAK
jgi:small basic protein (TIGR04137 family)